VLKEILVDLQEVLVRTEDVIHAFDLYPFCFEELKYELL
jgi:hypothetical protein